MFDYIIPSPNLKRDSYDCRRSLAGYFQLRPGLSDEVCSLAKQVSSLSINKKTLANSRSHAPAGLLFDNYQHDINLMTVDFGICSSGLSLVEIQSFSSVHAAMLTKELYTNTLKRIDGKTVRERVDLFKRALTNHEMEGVTIILDISPMEQVTTFDFIYAQNLFGVYIATINDLQRIGDSLYITRGNTLFKVSTIWNRVIPTNIPFDKIDHYKNTLCDLRGVNWIGHMDHFFSVSKASMPYIKHPNVNKSGIYLPGDTIPKGDVVLKPLYDFGGNGVFLSPTKHDYENILTAHLWQERIDFMPCVTVDKKEFLGEIRVMLLQHEDSWSALSMLLRVSEDGLNNQTSASQDAAGGVGLVI